MNIAYDFFDNPNYPLHKQYEALRAYFYEKQSACEVAERFGYSENSLYCLASTFKKQLNLKQLEKKFFAPSAVGRPTRKHENNTDKLIIALRKKYLSVSDIKTILDTQKQNISETYIYKLLNREGFARLPRRNKKAKIETLSQTKVSAPTTSLLGDDNETFNTMNVGILLLRR